RAPGGDRHHHGVDQPADVGHHENVDPTARREHQSSHSKIDPFGRTAVEGSHRPGKDGKPRSGVLGASPTSEQRPASSAGRLRPAPPEARISNEYYGRGPER